MKRKKKRKKVSPVWPARCRKCNRSIQIPKTAFDPLNPPRCKKCDGILDPVVPRLSSQRWLKQAPTTTSWTKVRE